MSAATLEREARPATDWILLDEPPVAPPAPVLSENWWMVDPVDSLLIEVANSGKLDELVRRLVGDDEAAVERLLLRAMQDSLAEDWNSSEDDIYNDL